MKLRLILTSAMIAMCGVILGQRNVRDSVVNAPHLSFSYAVQAPSFDMEERFGVNNNIGMAFHVKNKKNFYWGFEGSFMFGNEVKEPGLMQNLYTADGTILDNAGLIAEILVSQRGLTLSGNIGKVFPWLSVNPNSGVLLKCGAGFMSHKIRIEYKTEYQENFITQLDDEYLKGYDRLSNGLMLSQFAGYFYMGNSRVANFYAGFEFMQGFTQGRRSMNFDTQTVDNQPRFDMLTGFRVAWVIHLYQRLSEDVYIY